MAKVIDRGWAKPDDPIYKQGPVVGGSVNPMPVPMKQFCEQLGVNAETVQRWADAGEVRIWQPSGKGGKQFVFLKT